MQRPSPGDEPSSDTGPSAGHLFAGGNEHLRAELAWLAEVLGHYIEHLRAQFELTQEMFLGLHVPDELVASVLGAEPVPNSVDPWRLRAALDQSVRASRAAGVDLPWATLCERLALDPIEAGILLLAAAPALDLRYEALLGYAQNDAARRQPTVHLALELFAQPGERHELRARLHRSQLLRDGWIHLVGNDQRPSRSALAAEMTICDSVLDYLLDRPRDSRSLERRTDSGVVDPATRSEAMRVAAAAGPRGMIVIRGRAGSGRFALAEAAASALERQVSALELDTCEASELAPRLDRAARLARLTGRCLVLCDADALLGSGATAVVRASLAALRGRNIGPIFLTTTEARIPDSYTIDVRLPDAAARRALWQEATGDRLEAPLLDEIAVQFRMTPLQISRAASKLTGASRQEAFASARSECIHGLARLGTAVRARPSIDDLVVPSHVRGQLQELICATRQRHRVLHDWGFAARVPYGLGTYALFSGPSGTGKTFAAAVIAGELGLELYKIDLASVVSKYIGETEKNLDRVFREAEAASAMLLFDEADAMFGSRSEVTDARDRYANMEIAYLLQRMEEYEGVVILTTNLRKNIDDAFVRRIGHIIEFPFPDPALREQLFRRTLPAGAPVAGDIDFRALARRFELTGGNIRNALLTAAWLAADQNSAIEQRHLLHAISRELQKLGKLSDKALLE